MHFIFTIILFFNTKIKWADMEKVTMEISWNKPYNINKTIEKEKNTIIWFRYF